MIACKKETPNYNIRDNANSKQEQDILYEELHGINIGPINKYGLIADIHFMNDKLLMLDVKSDSIFVHYNLKGELKKSFDKGEGPNEFVSPQFLKITGFNNFSTDIQIFDFNKGLFKLNLIDQKKESYFTLGNYDYKTSLQSIVLIEEGIFAMANLDPLIKFSIYNDVVKKTKKIPHNKNFDIVNYKRYLESVTPVDIGFNKKHKLIYTWNGALNSIDLHDKNGVFIKSYSFGTNKNINNKNFDRKYFYYYNVKSQEKGFKKLPAFFDKESTNEVLSLVGQPDIITFTNVFAHIENLIELLDNLKLLIGDNTVVVIENHYLGSVLQTDQFDTFYHEHPRTYSLKSFFYISKLLNMNIHKFSFVKRYNGNIRVFFTNKINHKINHKIIFTHKKI